MSATASGPPRLMGRAAELEILSGLLDRVAERGGALAVREPGIGNTTLLGYLAGGASACVIVRLRGLNPRWSSLSRAFKARGATAAVATFLEGALALTFDPRRRAQRVRAGRRRSL
jgi:hypothetical protein